MDSKEYQQKMENALALHQGGKFANAEKIYLEVLNKNANDYNALKFFGILKRQLREFAEAEKAFRHAVEIFPNEADLHCELGKTLKQQSGKKPGMIVEALNCFQTAYELNPKLYNATMQIASILNINGKGEEAESLLKEASKASPDNPEIYNQLGYIQQRLGKTQEARANFFKATKLDPQNCTAYYNLAYNEKFKEEPEIINKMHELSSTETDIENKYKLHFALGKIYDDLKIYDKAIENFNDANQLKRKTFKFDINTERQNLEVMKQHFNAELYEKFNDLDSNLDTTPIFILGMTRSGSTLIEQILSSHSKVYGAGELTYLSMLILNQFETFPNKIHKAEKDTYSKLGKNYLELLKSTAGGEKFICDKMPGNFVYIGMIKLILPNAKIIHSKRNPVDTCFSNYKALFTSGHHHSYDLEELGQYYKVYQAYMEHWHSLFPGYIYDLEYENLIEDQENESKKLLEFCGLDWDENCLEFHKSKRQVLTASVNQVRRPLYKSSVEKWRNYEDALEPLINALS